MKFILVFALMVGISLQARLEKAQQLDGCNALYTRDVETVLGQFKALTNTEKIKEYERYMLITKLASDLRFTLDDIEVGFTSAERALLRTPLQRYNVCRTSLSSFHGLGYQNQGPSKTILTPCEKNYATGIQKNIDQSSTQANPTKLGLYKKFMILLKYYTDLTFEAEEFEKRNSLATKSRLKLPLQNYRGRCRDALIRTSLFSPANATY